MKNQVNFVFKDEKFKESNSEASSLANCLSALIVFSSRCIWGGFILFSDGFRLLRWTACSKILSVLLSAVPASRDREIPPFLLLWTLWDLRKDFIKPLTMTSWYMRLHSGLEDREQSDNPKHPAWRSFSHFWPEKFLGNGTKTTWRSTAYRAKWKLCCRRHCALFVTTVVHHHPRGDRNLLTLSHEYLWRKENR